MKLFVWNKPYQVNYGSSLLIVVAENEEQARIAACKASQCAFGDDWRGQKDWSFIVATLGPPTRILEVPCAEMHEWSE